MFYSASSLENFLKCRFCHEAYTDVVKILPQCGESICGKCNDDLRDELDEKSQFRCRACQEVHTMPESGLTDNKSFMSMLKLKPQEKPFSNEASAIKELLVTAQDKIDRIKSFDLEEAVNAHCDQLQSQVMDMVESAVKHVNHLGNQLIKEIDDYRQDLLSSASSNLTEEGEQKVKRQRVDSPIEQELDNISSSIQALSKEWNEYLTKVNSRVSEERTEEALEVVKDYNCDLDQLEARLRNRAFKNRIFKFKEDQDLFKSTNLLGEFTYESIANETLLFSCSLNGNYMKKFQKAIFLENGHLATVYYDKAINIWNPQTGENLHELTGHKDWVMALAQLPNGWLASGSRDTNIKIWNLNERKLIRTLKGHTGTIMSLKVLPNGKLASCSFDGTIKVWNPSMIKNNLLLSIEGHGIRTYHVDMGLMSNGHLVTCSNEEHTENTIRVWNSTDGSLVKSIPTQCQRARALLVLSDGRIAIAFSHGVIKIIDTNSQSTSDQITLRHGKEVYSLVQLPSGNLLSAGRDANRTFYIWNLSTSQLVQKLLSQHSDYITSLAFSPKANLLVSASCDSTCKIWSLTDDE